MRSKHSKLAVELAMMYAEKHGWKIKESKGYAWGRIYCPLNDMDCRCGEFCNTSIWSTPKNATNHARQIYHVIDSCKQQITSMKYEEV